MRRLKGVIVNTPPLDVFGQMAADETLALRGPDCFHVRFFNWQGGGATFGYAQNVREVERQLPPRTGTRYTRRPTGGGVVLHFDDITFSCVFPERGVLSPVEHYRRLHTAINAGLRLRGLETGLCAKAESGAYKTGGASVCFSNPVALDIMTGNGKVLGGAVRRYGGTVLYQGSLLLPGARERAGELRLTILRGLAAEWDLKWTHETADGEFMRAVSGLAEKYRSEQWIRRF
ncbi:MAG: hypothetical protein WCS77_03110 [Elusimicrobiaceae bacterium]